MSRLRESSLMFRCTIYIQRLPKHDTRTAVRGRAVQEGDSKIQYTGKLQTFIVVGGRCFCITAGTMQSFWVVQTVFSPTGSNEI